MCVCERERERERSVCSVEAVRNRGEITLHELIVNIYSGSIYLHLPKENNILDSRRTHTFQLRPWGEEYKNESQLMGR